MIKFIMMAVLLTAFSTHAKVTPQGQKDTIITAKSWLVSSEGQIVAGRNTKDVRPIASITKLVTAMVFLDEFTNPTKKQKELVQRAISSSDNVAARKLCEMYPGGVHDCVFVMNMKMKLMGLNSTKFVEPTGLSVFNVSTAEELVKIVQEASKYDEITKSTHSKKRNTNPLVKKHDLTVSKTGYILASGGCIVMMAKQKIVVILGSKNTHTRIPEAEALLKF
jgi:D-alanyl-D-alanine endopeptidase (penicillin-binding protein 7)